jgi:hypothetical protein
MTNLKDAGPNKCSWNRWTPGTNISPMVCGLMKSITPSSFVNMGTVSLRPTNPSIFK